MPNLKRRKDPLARRSFPPQPVSLTPEQRHGRINRCIDRSCFKCNRWHGSSYNTLSGW